jgi:hypothetical protein
LSDGRQVLRFRPTRWERHIQRLEITSGELLPGEAIPLLKKRKRRPPEWCKSPGTPTPA